MSRRVFLSYQHRDQARVRGFNLMRQSPNIEAKHSARHLLSPVDSNNPGYIGGKIREQLAGTSVTVVFVGRETHNSDWVSKEIAWSLEKNNGLLAVKLDADAKLPDALQAYGAETLDWTKPTTVAAVDAAIERTALRAGRAAAISASATDQAGGCSR